MDTNSYEFDYLKFDIAENVKVESHLYSIDGLINNLNVKFDPYYQRRYVWKSDKASYFLESILIGQEIPPIILFDEHSQSSKVLEVVDGRQRLETIKRFINNEITLDKKGLKILKKYNKYKFKDLNKKIRENFLKTNLRIFHFTPLGELKNDEKNKDLLKKEIFKRYNSGLTPLKTEDIDNATYIDVDLNKFIKGNIISVDDLRQKMYNMFLPPISEKHFNDNVYTEHLMKKIRTLSVMHRIPIKYYSWVKGKNELINTLFTNLSDESVSKEFFNEFKETIDLMYEVYELFVVTNKKYNYLVFEVLFWMLSILKNERQKISRFKRVENLNAFVNYISENIDIYTTDRSHFYVNVINRYNNMVEFFKKIYPIDYSKYLENNEESIKYFKKLQSNGSKKEVDAFVIDLNTQKPDSTSLTINELINDIKYNPDGKKRQFIIRPPYQRFEVMNQYKAAALIESILLGFKISPLYVYQNLLGQREIIDGQQRIIAVLAFMGIPYTDERGTDEKSLKNEFPLRKLRLRKDLEGKRYKDLNDEDKNKINNFVFQMITIKASTHPQFRPVDLFVRLNHKPYNILETSFEMWNGVADREIIIKIKEKTAAYKDWFYLIQSDSDTRMLNEEIFTTLVYLQYQSHIKDLPEKERQFVIYIKNGKMNGLIKNKEVISNFLYKANNDKNHKSVILNTIDEVDDYIQKLKILMNFETNNLKMEYDKFLGAVGKRTRHSIYLLWYIVSPLEKVNIEKRKDDISKDVLALIQAYKSKYDPAKGEVELEKFKNKIKEFWNKYNCND